jgi:hypothetical protein
MNDSGLAEGETKSVHCLLFIVHNITKYVRSHTKRF